MIVMNNITRILIPLHSLVQQLCIKVFPVYKVVSMVVMAAIEHMIIIMIVGGPTGHLVMKLIPGLELILVQIQRTSFMLELCLEDQRQQIKKLLLSGLMTNQNGLSGQEIGLPLVLKARVNRVVPERTLGMN